MATAMTAKSGGDSAQKALEDAVKSGIGLLGQFQTSLMESLTATVTTSAPPTNTSVQRIENPPNPLSVLSDSARLLKAHATKLGLLKINDSPPSAITKVVKEVTSTCLPAMMSGVQICEQEKAVWGAFMVTEVQVLVKNLFNNVEVMLVVMIKSDVSKERCTKGTGLIWEECDALIELEKLGIAGLAVKKAQQYQATIKDAIQELQEWKDGDDLDFEGQRDRLADSDDEGVGGENDDMEFMFNAPNSMPKNNPELVSHVDNTLSKLKKVVMLYEGVTKRRFKTFPASDRSLEAMARLDSAMAHLRKMPHQVDELVGRFYDINLRDAIGGLRIVLSEGKGVCADLKIGWDGGDDTFGTQWLSNWIAAVDQAKVT